MVFVVLEALGGFARLGLKVVCGFCLTLGGWIDHQGGEGYENEGLDLLIGSAKGSVGGVYNTWRISI